MVERRSALGDVSPVARGDVRLSEAPDFSLSQIAPHEREGGFLLGELPEDFGRAVTCGELTFIRIGPKHYWVVGPPEWVAPADLANQALVTHLSHSRTRLALEGQGARAVLARLTAVDFRPAQFSPGHFAMTGAHHMPFGVHCYSEDIFHLYPLRSFALGFWQMIAHVISFRD